MESANIAIIGGGPNGLVALYECKQRNIKATLYERESAIGGVWNLNSSNIRAHKSTRFNTSSFLSSYSLDFPLFQYLQKKYPTKTVDFVNSSDFSTYLCEFVKHYQLDNMIFLNKEITEIITGQEENIFRLNILDRLTGQKTEYQHNYIIIATGRYGNPIIPEYPFLSREIKINSDNVWHTGHWDPLNPDSPTYYFMDNERKDILVIGSGPSAGEAIQDAIKRSISLGNYEKLKIWWVPTRDPDNMNVWLVDRFPYKGRKATLPYDETNCRLLNYLPNWLLERYIRKLCGKIMVRDLNALPNLIKDRFCVCKTKFIKKGIEDKVIQILPETVLRIYKSDSNIICFETNKQISRQVDTVVLGSGYSYAEPKIDNEYKFNKSNLYRYVISDDKAFCGRLGFVCSTAVLDFSITIGQMEVKWLLYQWFDKNSNLEQNLENFRSQTTDLQSKEIKRPPSFILETLAEDLNVIPNIWINLLNLSSYRRHIALAYILGPWSIFHYGDLFETDEERLNRENTVLLSTENSFSKSGLSFRTICTLSDVIYNISVCSLLYWVYSILRM